MAIADLVNGKIAEPLDRPGAGGAGADVQPSDVLALAERHGAQMVDLKFTDLPGTWQHMGMALASLDEEALTDGIGFDGSSIRGFQEIYESDMLLLPDPSTAILDPFYEAPTVSLVCTVLDPITREPYTRDPRYVAIKAEEHLRSGGVADVCYFGPEAEFYVFDHVAFDQQANTAFYEVDSEEGHWTSGQGFQRRGEGLAALGYTNRSQEGYFPAPPNDTLSDLRASMVIVLEALGIRTESHHHEVGGPGQGEIDLRFLPLLEMADALQLHKYIVKNTAKQAGKAATFLPKPIFEENGSGMHVHQSLWKDGETLDARSGRLRPAVPAGSPLRGRPARARAGADGVLRAIDELLPPAGPGLRGAGAAEALPAQPIGRRADPDVLRVAEGQAAGVPAARPARQPVPRVPGDADGGAGRDRARAGPRRADRPQPLRAPAGAARRHRDRADVARRGARRARGRPRVPHAGGVFTDDLIATYIEFRREQSDRVKIRPHPYEFPMYFDG